MAVITISRQFGAGGWTFAARLSQRLGYKCINEEMIKEAASKLNVSSAQVHSFEKDGASKLMRFIDKLVNSNFIDRHISERYSYVNEQNYVEVISKIIMELYEKDNMIIIGRGSQFVLKNKPGTRHILLVQELSSRIEFMMNNYKLSLPEAEKAIKQRDQIRAGFLKFFMDKGQIDDPINYDVVINMDRVTMDQAENIVVGLIE